MCGVICSFVDGLATGKRLFTQQVIPENPRALVCYCHGYSENASWTSLRNAERLAVEAGVAVALIDYPGHGQSDGLSAFVPCFDEVLRDVVLYFDDMREKFPNLRCVHERGAFLPGVHA